MIKKIKINGKEYPCRMTMGAMMQFKQETGREASELAGVSLSDSMILLWCCVCSACRAEKISFDMSLMEMCDLIDAEDLATWHNSAFEQETATPAKKNAKKKA